MYKKKLNLSVNKMNLIADISKTSLVSKSSLLSPNSRIFAIVKSLCFMVFPLTWFFLSRKVLLSQWWLGQWRREWVVISIFWPQVHRDDTQSWKLSLNLQSPKWNDWVQAVILQVILIFWYHGYFKYSLDLV